MDLFLRRGTRHRQSSGGAVNRCLVKPNDTGSDRLRGTGSDRLYGTGSDRLRGTGSDRLRGTSSDRLRGWIDRGHFDKASSVTARDLRRLGQGRGGP